MENGGNFEQTFSFKALRVILYALLLTPLWIASIFLFPFITTKILYFRILVEAALFFYIILALRYPELRPRWNLLNGAVWIYVAVLLFTSAIGLNFYRSFWGNIERGEGIVTIMHFAAYFTMLPAVLRSQTDWYRYLLGAVTVTLLSALYGLAQLFGLPFVIHAGATRISGTIGNASFFAAFMLFGIFLSLYLQKHAPSKGHRIYLWSIFIFELVILFQSRTRGALLAAAGAFGLYFVVNVFKSQSKRLRIASLAGLILLVAGAGLIYANRNSQFVASNNTLYRLATISRSDITTQSRLDTWQASWRGWQDRLLFGYGYENYNIAFNKYFPARIFKDQGSQVWFDRAHNIIFDQGVTSGIIGLLFYLAILGIAAYFLLRLYRAAKGPTMQKAVLVLFLLLGAYFFQNLFVFDTQATYLMFFLLLAYIVFLHNEAFPKVATSSVRPVRIGAFASGGIALVLLVAGYFVNLQPARANIATTNGIKVAKLKEYRSVREIFERALAHGTYMDEEIRQRLVDYGNEAVASGQLSPQESADLRSYVQSELHKSIERAPHDVKNYLYLMNVLNQGIIDPRDADEVLSIGEEAVALSPTRPQIYFELGQSAFSKQDFELGLSYFRKAIELNPEPKESHFNYLLAAILASRLDIAAEEERVITEELQYKFTVENYTALARVYYQIRNLPKVLESYQKATELQPENPDLRARLAAVYGELCDIEQARAQVFKVIELNPSFTLQGQHFLRQLEQKCK